MSVVALRTQDGVTLVTGSRPILSCRRSETKGDLVLAFPTRTGARYVLECADTLTEPSWTTLTEILGDGTLKSLNDTGATNHQRFYRVRME